MRKIKICAVFIFFAFLVTACSNKTAETKIAQQNQVEKALEEQVKEDIDEQVKKLEEEEAAAAEESSDTQIVTENGEVLGGTSEFEALLEEARQNKAVDGIDYDLTLMSKDMIYATVYLFMTEPSEFEGKTVRMKGSYLPVYYEATGKNYSYCFISDAAGCCKQGIEFAVKGEAKYPDDFPKEGEEIEVVGTFATYMEDGKLYCHLSEAEMKVLEQGN